MFAGPQAPGTTHRGGGDGWVALLHHVHVEQSDLYIALGWGGSDS